MLYLYFSKLICKSCLSIQIDENDHFVGDQWVAVSYTIQRTTKAKVNTIRVSYRLEKALIDSND